MCSGGGVAFCFRDGVEAVWLFGKQPVPRRDLRLGHVKGRCSCLADRRVVSRTDRVEALVSGAVDYFGRLDCDQPLLRAWSFHAGSGCPLVWVCAMAANAWRAIIHRGEWAG